MALAPGVRADFRESLYRMIFALTAIGITVLSTLEMPETFTELLFSSYSISFLTDDIIRMRYVEIDGHLSQIMMVVKMRRTAHSREIRQYKITTDGIVIGERLKNYVDLITGIPQPLSVLRSEELLLNRKA
jgi:circadian clock protein KaiC